jgi:hypothetical protein
MCPSGPNLESIKTRIRADHAAIRTILDRIENLASGASRAEREVALVDEIWRLFLVFDEHLGYEERHLFPLVGEIEGEERTVALREEHRQQRIVLHAMVSACESPSSDGERLADNARWLVESLRADMRHEEVEVMSLSDDGFVPDQCTG